MTQDKPNDSRATHSRWPVTRGQIQALLIAFVMVVSIAVMPLASGFGVQAADTGTDTQFQSFEPDRSLSLQTGDTEDNVSYYDDFEDGNRDGWSADEPAAVSVVEDGFYGNYSVRVDDSQSSAATLSWDERTFDTGDSFELSGTFKATGDTTEGYRSLFGVKGDEGSGRIYIDHGGEYYYLSTSYTDSPDETEPVSLGVWNEFRMQYDSGTLRAKIWEAGTAEPSSWEVEEQFNQYEGKFMMNAGGISEGRELYLGQVDAGGNALSGQVVDQNGEPVPNATVGSIGVNTGAINDTIEDKKAEAERLMEEAQSVEIPDEWDSNYDPRDQIDDSGKYLLAHETSDWGGTSQLIVDPQSSIDDPVVQVDGDEQLVFSVWDGSQSGDWIENQYDGSFPGKIVEQSVKIEQFTPDGGLTNVGHYEPQVIAETSGAGPLGGYNSKEFYGVKKSLPTGIYRISQTGVADSGYVIMVGDAKDQWTALESELRNERDQLTERAKELQQNIESGLFERRTTTTDENGYFSLRMQQGVQTASVQAYRADGTILPDLTGPTFDDLRTAAETGDYNGTFDLSPPNTYDVPSQGVTIETYRTDELPFQGINSFTEFKNWLENQQLNETIEDIQSEYDKRFDEMNRTQLEARYSVHRPLVETIPSAEDRYLEQSEFDEIQDVDDLSNDELATEVGHMESVLTGMDQIEAPDFSGEDPIDIADGVLNAEYGPIPSGIDTDTLQPEIHWSNGESEKISDEYWSIESRGTFGTTNYLVVEDFPIGDADPAALDLRILGGGAGGMLDDRLSALNPSFAGSIPDVRAIDVSTLSPGNSERVSMTMRTGDDSNYGGLESVEVFGPNGQELTTSIDGDSASFEANGAGEHFVRATVTDTTGGQFVHTFSVRALDQGRQNPPTVRAETATGDRVFAIAGDGLDDAEIRADGDQLEIDAIAPGGEIPSSIHVKPQAAMDTPATSIDVRVLEGVHEATVDTTVETVIHLDSLAEDAVVWRGEPGILGQPIADGGTRYGEVMQRGGEDSDKVIIRTYSEPDGSVSLTINEQPGWWDGNEHWLAQKIPRPNIPFLSVAMSAVSSLTIFGIGLFTRRRWRLAR